jgi:hypothetical protein
VAAPALVKNPRFIGGAIVSLWVVYVVYRNYRLDPISIQLMPFLKPLQVRVSSVIVGAAIFGCLSTLAIQLLWRRGRSKNESVASTAPADSSKTVA